MTALTEAAGRAFTCATCQQPRITATLTGPFPRACDECIGPEGVALRERRREQGSTRLRRLATERDQLAQRVRLLEALLRADGDLSRECGEPSREAVARAVIRLARAEGKDETRHALLVVSDVTRAWAARL